MSLLYSSPISYSEPNIGYFGSLIINIPGISSPINIGNLNLSLLSYQDNSNATVVGVISYDIRPSGILEITTTQEQAEGLIKFINLNSSQQKSAEISLVSI